MQTITTPIVRAQDVKVFERLEKDGILSAYTECVEAKARPWYIPELVDAKTAPNCNDYLWKNGFTQPSIMVTGRSQAGNAVVVYDHCLNYFSDLENLRKVYQAGLINGAGIMPQDEFLKLLDSEDGKTVFVRDHQELMNSVQGEIKVSKCSAHPMVVPFLGGKDRTESYLDAFAQKIGSSMYLNIINDLGDVAKGRWLVLRGDFSSSFGGNCYFDNNGRVLGVESSGERSEPVVKCPQGATLEKEVSPLETILGKGTEVGNGLVVIR